MSRPSAPYAQARDALADALRATYGGRTCEREWPCASGASVAVGAPGRDLSPLCAWVEEGPQSMEGDPHATGRTATFSWELVVCLWAKAPTREQALSAADHLCQAAVAAVLADPTLGRTVERAVPRVEELQVAQGDDRRWCAGASVEVACRAGDVCGPAGLAEEIRRYREASR